jgi:RNase adapter protein RapZ
MRLILVSGMSGSGKSVAIRLLEDIGIYCVDNLPSPLLTQVCELLANAGYADLAVSIDARSEASMAGIPDVLGALRAAGHDVRVLFLTAATDALVQRFSETRRRHPLSLRLDAQSQGAAPEPTLEESIEQERELLAPLYPLGHVIDTSSLPANTLRQWVRAFVDGGRSRLTLAFESFAFKNGVPVAADLVFDVRNLPNPHYETDLRSLSGLDAPVIDFLARSPLVEEMIDDIARLVEKWLPSYVEDGRQYLTVAIGCTGGQHRSPYVVEQLAARLRGYGPVLIRHRGLQR